MRYASPLPGKARLPSIYILFMFSSTRWGPLLLGYGYIHYITDFSSPYFVFSSYISCLNIIMVHEILHGVSEQTHPQDRTVLIDGMSLDSMQYTICLHELDSKGYARIGPSSEKIDNDIGRQQ